MTLLQIPFSKWHLLFLFLLGAVFGSIGDFCHVASATTNYPDYGLYVPVINLPYWVPVEFGLATLILGVFHPIMDASFAKKKKTKTRPGASGEWALLSGVLALVGIWASSAFLPLDLGGAKNVILAGMALSVWFFLDKTASGILMAALTAIAGTSVEIFLVHQEIFSYAEHSQTLFGVASWLPWIYVTASVTVGNVSEYFLSFKTR